MSDAFITRQRVAVEMVYRNEASIWQSLRDTAAHAAVSMRVFENLQSVPVAGKEKTRPASLHDLSLIRDVA
jgi:hypothetical protein